MKMLDSLETLRRGDPEPEAPHPFPLVREMLDRSVDTFVASADVLFREYDVKKSYDEKAKKYTCKKMPWKIDG